MTKILLAVLVALAVRPAAFGEPAEDSRSAADGWIVRVSVRGVDLGPVDVSVGSLRPATGWGRQWLEHELVLTNTGDREVTFADTWTVGTLGPRGHPMLLAEADGRCGYRAVRPLRAACILPLIFVDIKPGRSVTRITTLWRGLRRMEALKPGTYVFRQPLRFRLGKYPPAEGEGRIGTILLVYTVQAGA